MTKYQLNLIPFQPKEEYVRILFSKTFEEGYTKMPSNFLPKGIEAGESKYWYFKKVTNEDIIENSGLHDVSLFKNKKFSRFYFNSLFLNRCCQNDIRYRLDFISSPTLYIPFSETAYSGFNSFRKFNLRVLTDRFKQQFSLLVSYEGLSHLSIRNIEELSLPDDLFSLVDIGNMQLEKYKTISVEEGYEPNKTYPFLNYRLQKHLELGAHQLRPENKYKENYLKISEFLNDYIKPEFLEDEIKMNPSFFFDIPSEYISETSNGSNLLEFGNHGSNFSPYHGLKEYGPFQEPQNKNIKLLFIFHKDDNDTANKLYSYFKKGYKSFSGLYQFVKVPVDIDVSNSIKYSSDDNPYSEIVSGINPSNLDKDYKYAAIYISRIKKNELEAENQKQYYKIKEFLLSHSITSQVIFKDNVENEYFNFYLPNIAIALLAKLDGKPWRLKRPKRQDLVVGIGAYRPKSSANRYLGNAFYFQNDGTFHEFDSFIESDIAALSKSYEESIKSYMNAFGKPSRLIIHFYKVVSKADVRHVEKVLSKLSLSIPIIIISINKTESSDFILYDKTYDGLMPVSGTYIRLGRNEFLLCNNSRYSKSTGSYIEGFPFPLKFKIYSTDESLLENNELIRELIDQIYQFSRMYWKSVKQKNLPVTIEYSEILAELFSRFDAETLPAFGKRNLWFL